jgi:hypothetical protein
MKKIFLTSFAVLSFAFIFAQAPVQFKYQAVARNSSGAELVNANLPVRVSIHQGTVGGTIAFTETHNVTTSPLGLFSISIGSVNTLSINWANGPYFIETEINFGSGFVSMGTSQLLSVPYALYAETAGNAGPKGATGSTGAAGTNGTNGATGVTGATGTAGTNGTNGVTGAAGTNGTNGVTGATGATGTAGTNGTNGVTGTAGTNGTNGVTGVTGATGTTGTAGTNGTNGVTGTAGTNGTNGVTGATGTAGTNGTNGVTGVTGTAGTNGTNGATGVTGATGTAGTNGTTGVTGATGTAGTNGTTGATGAAGTMTFANVETSYSGTLTHSQAVLATITVPSTGTYLVTVFCSANWSASMAMGLWVYQGATIKAGGSFYDDAEMNGNLSMVINLASTTSLTIKGNIAPWSSATTTPYTGTYSLVKLN